MGRPSNREARQEQIADALARLMTRTGFAETSIQDIAKEAQVAPGLVHHHFESKQAILLHVVEGRAARLASDLEAIAPEAPLDRLTAVIDRLLALGPDTDANTLKLWNAIGAEAMAHAGVRTVYRRSLRRMLRVLTESVAMSLVPAGPDAPHDEAGRIAEVIMCTIEGIYRVAAGAPGLLPRGEAASRVHQLAAALIAQVTQPAPKTRRGR